MLSELSSQRRVEQTVLSDLLFDLHSPHKYREFRKYGVQVLQATYLPKQPISDNDGMVPSEGSFAWVYCLTDLVEPSQSLDAALLAFCLTQLHVTGTGATTLNQCLAQYDSALKHLYADIDDEDRRLREETLAAILLLTTCEARHRFVLFRICCLLSFGRRGWGRGLGQMPLTQAFQLFVCPETNAWSVHARGIFEILRLRPELQTTSTPAWRHMFSRLRIVCVSLLLLAQTPDEIHLGREVFHSNTSMQFRPWRL